MRIDRPFGAMVMIFLGACGGTETRPVAPMATATFVSDAEPISKKTPNGLVLHKSLDAYKTFGGYDVAYKGQTASWHFAVPRVKVRSARVVLSMSADDHLTAIADYRYTVWSGEHAYESPAPLSHGTPAGAPFDHWTEIDLPADIVPGQTFTIAVTNASAGGTGTLDWIAAKWVELRLEVEEQ